MTVIICLSAILMQASRNGNDLWLSYWVDTTTESSQTRYSVSFYLVRGSDSFHSTFFFLDMTYGQLNILTQQIFHGQLNMSSARSTTKYL